MALELNGTNKIVHDNLNNDIRTLLQPKNWIINGMFDVWQRGTSQTSSGYGSDDRWGSEHNISTKTHSRQTFSIGQIDVPNNPTYFSRTIVSSVSNNGSYVHKQQKIEDVTKLAGKTITVSFWAKADASKNMAIEFAQVFGTGGSSQVTTLGVQKIALTTSWQRFTKTVTLPSVSGKTIGEGSFTQFRFWFDAGTLFDSRTDSLGNQSGTFDIANVSLVEGSVAVECQNQPYADVLRECQRYYQRIDSSAGADSKFGWAKAYSATSVILYIYTKVPLRIYPSSLDAANLAIQASAAVGYIAISSVGRLGNYSNNDLIAINATATGMTAGTHYEFGANSSTSAYIGLNSEL